MALDSRDVVILAKPKEILNEFKLMGIKMLIGAETNPGKGKDLKRFWDRTPEAKTGPFRYPNSGQWIAEREFAKQLFEQALKIPPRKEVPISDQLALSNTLCYSQKRFYPKLKLDHTCRIFQIINSFDLVDIVKIMKESNNKEIKKERTSALSRILWQKKGPPKNKNQYNKE